MNKKRRPLLIPQYMHSFTCIGSKCEDSCCIGWQVSIDRITYKKYQKLKEAELKPALDKYIGRNRSQPSEEDYGRIRLNSDSSCPFLTEERLCRIQARIGEQYLSDVCTTYPRTSNIINGTLEKSATLSCPEAARKALLNPEPMEFDQIEESLEARNIIKTQVDINMVKAAGRPEGYFWELRIFTIQVLQNRVYTLGERLIMLGMFYQKVEQFIQANQSAGIPNLIASYIQLIDSGAFKEELSEIPVQVAIQMELLKELADERIVRGVSSQRYIDCFKQCLQGLQYSITDMVEDIADRYQEAEKKYYRPFMNDHDYIMENYLVNFVFKNMFPFCGEKNIFNDYVMLVVHYALIKMHLIGMAALHQGLNEELVITLIQSFVKTVEHNEQYLKLISDLLKQNGYTTMAYMAILINN